MQPANYSSNAPGRLTPTLDGRFLAFVPDALPDKLPISGHTHEALTAATFALGELRGIGRTVVNPGLIIRPFARREAILSSRIEGTTAGLADLVLFEATQSQPRERPNDVREVSNYLKALEHGLALLDDMPICNRLIREAHRTLLTGVRGHERQPGYFRDTQNAIGNDGQGAEGARFIPPPAVEMRQAMDQLERYIGERQSKDHTLVQAALIHYQFEAIHPFMDGNGRLGRLLIPLFLHERALLPQPLLYVSAYLEQHREEYKDHLLAVSQRGAWDEWLQFFLRGVQVQAESAIAMADRLLSVQLLYRDRIRNRRASSNVPLLIDALFASPAITAPWVATYLNVTPHAAYTLIERLVEFGIIEQVEHLTAPRVYLATEIIQATMPEEVIPATRALPTATATGPQRTA